MLLRADGEAEGSEYQGTLLEVADIPVESCASGENVSLSNMSEMKDGEPPCLYSTQRYLYLELYRHEIVVKGLLAPSLPPVKRGGEFTQP